MDEHYESPETAALHEEGYEGTLVARAGSPSDLISMSAYGKPQPPLNLQGFDHGRPYADTSFTFNTSVYGTQASASVATTSPVYQNSAQMTQMAYNSNQARTTYDDQTGPYLHVGSTPIPEVTSFVPSRGSRGDKFSVFIASLYELQTTSSPSFYLMFGSSKCGALLTKLGQQGATCSYTVSTEVPQFTTTRWNSAEVPVFMFMETGDGDVMAKVTVGSFTFTENTNSDTHQSAQDASRKRKISTDSTELMTSPAKRASNQLLRPKNEYSSYNYMSTNDPSRYTPYLQTNSAYGQNILQQRYNQAAGGYHSQTQPRNLAYSYSNSTTTSSPKIKTQSPQATSWNSSYSNTGSNMTRSPGVPTSATLSRPGLSSSSVCVNPPLIRTTTIQTSSPATTPGAQFNAYALYPHKAKLEINGDLDSMAQNWSEEEWEAKRRLVHFRRSQSGSTITATFQPVSAEDRRPDSVCISCIYWEEKNECFVTSVDTIYLLEQLVAARFTIEEKNRIRRNLEGFRPLTVSKSKADSEEFFKVIMAFPSPKPRNIEKDVKAFHWKDLGGALKKIIGKYSASPSSTLPPAALATPVSSTGYVTENSSTGISYVDHHGGVSPRSITGSATSTAYTGNHPARVVSPHVQKPLTAIPDVRVPVSVTHPHETSVQQWPGTSNHNTNHMATSQQYQQQQHQQQLGNQAQTGRGSWDMASYLENNTTTAGGPPGSASSMGYGNQNQNAAAISNIRNAADNAVIGGENRTVRTQSLQNSHQMPRT